MVQPDKSWRADVAQRHAYANEVDLWVNGMRISVKSRRVDFTCPEDIPPNRNPLFVDTVRKWQLKSPKPVGVICVSQSTRGTVWLPTSTKAHWGVRGAYDHTRGYADAFITADRTLWQPLDTLYEAAQHAWDGCWKTRTGVLAVRNGYVALEGTTPHLRWLKGQKFYKLAQAATVPPTRVTEEA